MCFVSWVGDTNRLKVDHWQQQMGELEECIANLQLKRSEQISESESALEFMKERLQVCVCVCVLRAKGVFCA